jgi:hypothetical protein
LRRPASFRNLLSIIKALPCSDGAALRLIVLGVDRSDRHNRKDTIESVEQVGSIYNSSYADFDLSEIPHVLNFIVTTTEICFASQIWVPPAQKHWISHARRMIITLDDDSYLSITLDQGMDWARPRQSYQDPAKDWSKPVFDENREFVTNESYVVLSSEITELEIELMDKGYEPPHFIQIIESTL